MSEPKAIEVVIDDIPVEVIGGEIDEEELRSYIAHGHETHGRIEGMSVVLDGEYADIRYALPAVGFDRIRRITGYLVGTLDRFNNGKRAEVMDRVKHSCC